MVKIILVNDVIKQMKKDAKLIMKIARGEAKLPKYRQVRYMTPKTFAKLFSTKRLELLTKIKDNNLKSISDLARKTNRRFEAVHRDCAFLASEGLIQFKEKNNAKIPILCGKLNFSIA